MIQPSVLNFLKTLQKNNNKGWFDKHRQQYEEAKTDFNFFIDKIIPGIAAFDPPIGDLLTKNCTFRINRDVRFSKDKKPYKNNMAAYFNKAGKKGNGAGYYLHIEPGKSFAAGGLWGPEPTDLLKIRQELDYNFDEWGKLIIKPSFKKQFKGGLDSTNSLLRPPKGYTEENPALHYLKLKSFVVRRPFTDTDIQSKMFIKQAVKAFLDMKPMIDFLNRAID